MKKVLIVIGDIGSGHMSAAKAIAQQIQNTSPDVKVTTVDLFTYKSKNNNKRSLLEKGFKAINNRQTTNQTYEFISKNPLITYLYDQSWKFSNTKIGEYTTRKTMISMYKYELMEILDYEKPDIVLSIHPLVNMVVNNIKDLYHFKYCTIITDLISLQSGWIDKKADIIFTPTKSARMTLIKNGINKNKIVGPLFPIKPQFRNVVDKSIMINRLGLQPNKTTLLLFGGGSGIYSSLRHIKRLLKTDKYQILIVTGKSKDAYNKLSKRYKLKQNVTVLGFVNNIQDMMNTADVVISKTGPGTIMELETLNKKAIFTKYIGEQEYGNIFYISKNPYFRYIGDRTDLVNEMIEELKSLKITQNPRRSVNETAEIVRHLLK